MGYLAGGVGPFVGGRVLDATGNLHTAFEIIIGVAVAATVLSFVVPETGRKAQSKVMRINSPPP